MDIEDNLLAVALAWAIIIILPYIIFGFDSFVYWTTIPDLVDIIFYLPVMGSILYSLYKKMKMNREIPTWLEYLAILLLFLHFEGHGFHWAANAIDVLTEKSQVTGSVHEVAYFLDEIVSHIIYFAALIVFFYVLSYIEYAYGGQEIKSKIKVYGSGIFFSFVYSISMIEGQFIYLGLFLAAVYIAIIGFLMWKYKKTIETPVIMFWLIYSIFVFVWSGVYVAIFGSLKQPSEIMK